MADFAENNDARPLLNVGGDPLKLSDLLDRGWKIYEEVDSTNEPLGSSAIQSRVKLALRMLEEASRMVAQLDLFSRNEGLEEIATADLKYMLLPALLGAVTLKQTGIDKRTEILQAANAYFMDFLRRCKDYDVSTFELPRSTNQNRNQDKAAQNGLSTAMVSGQAKYPNQQQQYSQCFLNTVGTAQTHVIHRQCYMTLC